MATENCNATVNVPPVGYHTLELLEGLRKSYNNATKEIEKVENLTRPYDYQKIRRLENLRAYREKLKAEFDYQSELVENWVAKFPDKDAVYGDVIVEYYCDINNAVTLREIIDEILIEDDDKNKKSNNFRAKIRTITLNQVQNN